MLRSRRPGKKQFGETVAAFRAEHPTGRVFAVDEARFGLKTWFRRRWCPRGHRPPWLHQHRYEWTWLYAAVEPATGESLTLYMPHLDGDCFGVFLEELRRAYPDDAIRLVLDGAGAHVSAKVGWPEAITPLPLPPRSPELDPAERWFGALRGPLANTAFESLAALEAALSEALRPYWEDAKRLARLTGYGWWTAATGSILTS
ncbi:MAG: IS630 family transposase [Bacteroidota bacterium]